jgi:hypothetical protein
VSAEAGCVGVELDFGGPGGSRRLPLSACRDLRFEDAVPARSFRWSRGHFAGWWWLATTGRHVSYESWLERDHLTRRYTREDIQRNRDAKRAKYAAIRRDALDGMSERAIERKHHVGRRTIVKALASADQPERKKIHREPAALDGLHATSTP